MEKNAKNILVISYNGLELSSPNGRTMQSLVQGISPEHIFLFSCAGSTSGELCHSQYRITDKDAVKKIVPFTSGGGILKKEETMSSANYRQNRYTGIKKPWKYVVRELVWECSHWKTSGLKNWLKETKSDCILFMYTPSWFMQKFAIFTSKFLNIPLIVYSCEDYCFKDFNYINRDVTSIAFKYYHHISCDITKKLFLQASALICNSDELGRLYKKCYNLDAVYTIMMASKMKFVENVTIKDTQELKVAYLGALGIYRTKALEEIADALSTIDKNLKLHVYGRISDEETKKAITQNPKIEYHGFVSYAEVQEVMRSSSLLIEAINFEEYIIKDKKFGFSTKYADSLACGTPFLVYAPREIVETQFVEEHDCAFVAGYKEQLADVLKNALFSKELRKMKVAKALEITNKYFDMERNVRLFSNIVNSAEKIRSKE